MIPLVKVKLVENHSELESCNICYYGEGDIPCPTDGNASLLCCAEDNPFGIWQQYDIPTKLKEVMLGRRRYKQVDAKEGCRECYFYSKHTMKCNAAEFNYEEITNDCTNNGKIWKPVIVLKDLK